MKQNKLYMVVSLIIVATMVLAACSTPAATTVAPAATTEVPATTEAPTAAPTALPTAAPRNGGWLDQIVISVVDSASAITQIKAGAIDIYANTLASTDLPAIKDAGLKYGSANGVYYNLLFNPVGPTFTNGTLNPFFDHKIREAMNWLVDRNYLNQEMFAGGSLPKYLPITTYFPDYAEYADVARGLEAKYAYNFDKAKEVITTQMEAMGATLGADGKWQYKEKPVNLVFLIRPEDGVRKTMGDYIANQLETIGFTVDRQYKKSTEASPIWIGSDPKEGQWNIYTAAWSAVRIDRAANTIIQEMYLPESAQGIHPFLDNTPTAEFSKVANDLAQSKFTSLDERRTMFTSALNMALEDSLSVWLIDGKEYAPYAQNVEITNDLAAGIEGAQIWPFTARFVDKVGGSLKWGIPDLFTEPWNPVAGSNWAWDQGIIKATMSGDQMYDPYTGLLMPLRIDKATVTVKEGLPVFKSLDWVTLETAPEIKVPEDTWVDWDAKNQVWITAKEKFPDGLTALRKSVTVYPADLFTTVKWHDGSPLSMGDIMMGLIMTFDRAKKDSKLYDADYVYNYESFMSSFKGFKITSTDPLTFEYYSDLYYQDAELNVGTLWPTYLEGEGSWPVLAVANKAEEDGQIAYSNPKAGELKVEQTSFVGGPSLEILTKTLDTVSAESYIPFAPTMGQYVTPDEAKARYDAVKAFYTAHGHYWIGTGPYILDKVFPVEKSATLVNNSAYPDLSDRWSGYSEPKIADVLLDGPGQVKVGEQADYTVSVSFKNEPYPQAEIKQVKYLLYNPNGEIINVGEATFVSDGEYSITLTADQTKALGAGACKVEVAVVPYTVSIPTFTSMDFVTVP